MNDNDSNKKTLVKPKAKTATIIYQYLAWGGAILSLVMGFLFVAIPQAMGKFMQSIGLFSHRFDPADVELINKPFIFMFIIIALLCYGIYRIFRQRAKQEVEAAINAAILKGEA